MPGRNSFDGSAYCESDQGIELNPWQQLYQATAPCPRESESFQLDLGTEALVTAQGVAATPERQVCSLLSSSAFLSQADSLKVSVKGLDTLKLQAAALHERIRSPNFLEDLVGPVDESGVDTTITHALAHSTQQATLIDLAYQASAQISSIYSQLLALQTDLEETPKQRDFKSKKSSFQSLLVAFKVSLLSYTSEQCNYKFLLKKKIRNEYLSLRRDASEAEVNKAVEDKTDWGMGLVKRDPVASFVERLGLGDSSSSAMGDNEFYSVNGGWEDTTPQVKEVLDRVASLRGEVKRVELIVKELRGLYRGLEGMGNIVKRDRLASRGAHPELSVGNGMLHAGERQMGMERKDIEVLCCGALGRNAFRGWTARILTAVGRTGVGAFALLDKFMMGARRESGRGRS